MTEYNRHTTTKGQLLLNIKPPSAPRLPQPTALTTQNNIKINSTYVPNNGLNNSTGYRT